MEKDQSPSQLGPKAPKPERVHLACIQCRGRKVKCDATQPTCNRCRRDGRECTYQKSRRGGLDRAALATRRLTLQQRQHQENIISTRESRSRRTAASTSSVEEPDDHIGEIENDSNQVLEEEPIPAALPPTSNSVSFQITTSRFIALYYDNFHRAHPILPPRHFLEARLQRKPENHGFSAVLKVILWIGSIFLSHRSRDAISESYMQSARSFLHSSSIPRTGFSVQALLLFALAEHNQDMKREARRSLTQATALALELGMNTKDFARRYGEGDSVLEESWRRTYYLLALTDQHCAVLISYPDFSLRDVPNEVELPCEEDEYEEGRIPSPRTLEDYRNREFSDIDVVYSSFAYLIDVASTVTYIMRTFNETGQYSEALVSSVDTKLAIWRSLLPACKKDPLRTDGTVDEIMYLAHMLYAIISLNSHRPLSTLHYSPQEFTTKSFLTPIPILATPLPSSPTRLSTSTCLRSTALTTRLLALASPIQHHSTLIFSVIASTAMAQCAACTQLGLRDRADEIARDRLRLMVASLKGLAGVWRLAGAMEREVRAVARDVVLSGCPVWRRRQAERRLIEDSDRAGDLGNENHDQAEGLGKELVPQRQTQTCSVQFLSVALSNVSTSTSTSTASSGSTSTSPSLPFPAPVPLSTALATPTQHTQQPPVASIPIFSETPPPPQIDDTDLPLIWPSIPMDPAPYIDIYSGLEIPVPSTGDGGNWGISGVVGSEGLDLDRDLELGISQAAAQGFVEPDAAGLDAWMMTGTGMEIDVGVGVGVEIPMGFHQLRG